MMAAFGIFMLGYVVEGYFPWWSVAIVAFIVGMLMKSSGWKAFLSGFAGVGLMWAANALFFHYRAGGLLTERVAHMFTLPSPWLLVALTGLVGGVVGGLAASAGFHLRGALQEPQRDRPVTVVSAD